MVDRQKCECCEERPATRLMVVRGLKDYFSCEECNPSNGIDLRGMGLVEEARENAGIDWRAR